LLPLTTPRPASLGLLREDLAAGEVTAVFFDARANPRDTARLTPVTRGASEEPFARPTVTWQTGPLQTWTAPRDGAAAEWTASEVGRVDPARAWATYTGERRPDGDPTALEQWIRTAVRAAGVPEQQSFRPLLEVIANWLAVDWWIVAAMVVVGPQPRCATRWASFWRVLMPLNAGAWSILLREAPWNLRTSAEPQPLPHGRLAADPRPTGGQAFLCFVLSSVAVGAAWPLVINALQLGVDRLLGLA